jgi:hypothetical protein
VGGRRGMMAVDDAERQLRCWSASMFRGRGIM